MEPNHFCQNNTKTFTFKLAKLLGTFCNFQKTAYSQHLAKNRQIWSPCLLRSTKLFSLCPRHFFARNSGSMFHSPVS
jgi:hypothetical protein